MRVHLFLVLPSAAVIGGTAAELTARGVIYAGQDGYTEQICSKLLFFVITFIK